MPDDRTPDAIPPALTAEAVADWHERSANFAERVLAGYREQYRQERIDSDEREIAWHRAAAAAIRAALLPPEPPRT